MRVHVADLGPNDGGRYAVFVNGQRITKVIMADERNRFVLRYRTDKAGRFIVNSRRDDVLRESLQGEVRIVDMHGWMLH